MYPLFRHSSLRVLQGIGVAVDAFEVAAFRQFPRQFYAEGTRRIVIMCYQEFVGKTVMVFHFFNLGITLEQVLAEEVMRFPPSGVIGDLHPLDITHAERTTKNGMRLPRYIPLQT